MNEIFRIFDNYDSRLRPFIGQRLNVTGPALILHEFVIFSPIFSIAKLSENNLGTHVIGTGAKRILTLPQFRG